MFLKLLLVRLCDLQGTIIIILSIDQNLMYL